MSPTFCYASPLRPSPCGLTNSLRTVSQSYLLSVKFEALYKSLSEVFEDCHVHWYVYVVCVGSKLHLGARAVSKTWVFPKSSWMDKNPVCFQLPLSLSFGFGSCLAHWEVKPWGLLGWEPQWLDVFVLKIKLSGSLRRNCNWTKIYVSKRQRNDVSFLKPRGGQEHAWQLELSNEDLQLHFLSLNAGQCSF